MSSFLDFIKALKGYVPSGEEIAKNVLFMENGLDKTTIPTTLLADDKSADFFTNGDALVYPQNLFSPGNEAYILFNIRDGVKDNTKTLKRIALYMPPGIKVGYGAEWGSFDDTFGRSLDAAENLQGVYAKGGLSGVWETIAETVGFGAQNLGAAAVAKKLNLDPRQVTNFLKRREGLALNPNSAMIFDSINFRKFQFDFQLFARTKDESESIRQIIKVFKWAMHPSLNTGDGGSTWLALPHVFDIKLKTPDDKYMFNIQQSALTNMDVQYGGTEAMSFFDETKAPVEITMSLEFTELAILTKERVLQNY